MKISHDSIGYVITEGNITRRYCNYTREQAISDFKLTKNKKY